MQNDKKKETYKQNLSNHEATIFMLFTQSHNWKISKTENT
jgi:hypothetical protein